MILNASSEKKLKGVHPDLVRVVRRAAKDWKDPETGWIITCGARTLEEQKVLKAKGASKTLRSRHIPAANGYSHAVDFAMTIKGVPRWDWGLYSGPLATAVKAAAKAEKVLIEWGGDWKFKDGPHFQLPWATHPGKK